MPLPSLNITFKTQAASLVERSPRGTILIILKEEEVVGENPFTVLEKDDIPSGLTAENKKYIEMALLGAEYSPRKVIGYQLKSDEGDVQTALDWAATQKIDYVVMPTATTDTATDKIKTWVIAQKDTGNEVKAVLPNTVADNEYIINYTTDEVTVEGGTKYTAEQFCPRIAGIICGTELAHSITYTPIPEAVDCTRKTKAEMDTAVDAGKLFVFFDGEKVKLSRGVNSLTTTTPEKGKPFQKIKIVEAISTIKDDLKLLCQDQFLGKYENSYDNRVLLLSAVDEYFETLKADGILSSHETTFDTAAIKKAMKAAGIDYTDMTDEEIQQYDFGTQVFIQAKLNMLDAIEDIYISIEI